MQTHHPRLVAVAVALTGLPASAQQVAESYRLATPTQQGDAPKNFFPYASNGRLEFAGVATDGHAWRFSPETGFTRLQGLAGRDQYADPAGMNDAGVTVGYVSANPREQGDFPSNRRAVAWDRVGRAVPLDDVVPAGDISVATAVNDAGDVLVQYAAGYEDDLVTTVVRHRDGTTTVLPAAADGSSVLGTRLTSSGLVAGILAEGMKGWYSQGAFLWSPTAGMQSYPQIQVVRDVNAAGVIVGIDFAGRPRVWTPAPHARELKLPHLPGGVYTSCDAGGINDAGVVVGECGWYHAESGEASFRAVAWTPVGGRYEVVDLTPRVRRAPDDTGRIDEERAFDIDERGRIVVHRDDRHGYVGPAFLVPEHAAIEADQARAPHR